ncbi:Ig-like domain-containing protein, partial [Falsiroseomonas sp. HW251]|uniref:Ig-like domain-containing protein n=1 Tax=Falsiroseomonas sp. HW251 TaxID=3390998 RepID=UPI003D32007A
PVNDAPTSTDDTVSVTEDTTKVLSVSDFGTFSDVDTGGTFGGVVIYSLPANGTLKLNGGDVEVGFIIAASDIAAGLLTYTPAPNDDTGESFTFAVYD